ncbi:hypothetical protein [Phaeocystidibacter luteus]|uniref:Uncharacterized protein n=1 Tax=Phaeocystidibacter luteus TaxID=911197 RepID=A0A6N6RCU2_9FLAO|nr:hypothetical protein [Phaeocystidibacter luteus]KAB2805457.1 hypothetical protein F8C67_13475 [Phaeocystidibacter luteus]
MRSNLATWMKGKLDQINDRATSADWANMEEMLNAHPSFAAAPKPWYKTNLGIGGLITAAAILIGLTTWVMFPVEESDMVPTLENSIVNDAPAEVYEEPQIEDVSSTSSDQASEAFTPQIPSSSPSSPSTSRGASPADESVVADANIGEGTTQEDNPSGGNLDESNTSIVNSSSTSLVSTQNTEGLREVVPTDVTETSPEVSQESTVAENSTSAPQSSSFDIPESDSNNSDEAGSNGSTSVGGIAMVSGTEMNTSSEASAPVTQSDRGNTGSSNTTIPSAGGNSNAVGSEGREGSSNETGSESIAEVSEDESPDEGTSSTPAIANEESNSAQPESSSAAPVIRSMRSENAIEFSLAAYGTYDLGGGEQSNENGRSYEWNAPLGYGIEVEASWKGWTASSGVMYHDEAATYSASSFSLDTNRSAAYWYEADTQQVTIIDSTWVIQGINQGYWQVDTTVRNVINHELNERLQYSQTTTTSQTNYRWAGYRLSAPLLVGKRWDIGRFTTGIHAGPVFTFRSATLFTNESFQTNYTEFGTDLLVRAEVGYRITDHFDLFGRASYRTNATANTLYGKAAWSQAQIPVSFGMRYRF